MKEKVKLCNNECPIVSERILADEEEGRKV